MPKRKYNAAQQAELDLLTDLHLEKVRGRAVIRARIEAELRDALNDLELKESRQANICLAAKITKTDIRNALGTGNWETMEKTLARTALDLTPDDFDPMSKVVVFDENINDWTIHRPNDEHVYVLEVEKGFGYPVYEYDEAGDPLVPSSEWRAWWKPLSADAAEYVKAHPHA